MYKVLIVLLFCVAATAQLVDHTACPQGEICRVSYDDLIARVDKLDQRANLQFKVLVEYSLMQAELEDMHDDRVNRIMHKHLLAIGEYVKQMKALDSK